MDRIEEDEAQAKTTVSTLLEEVESRYHPVQSSSADRRGRRYRQSDCPSASLSIPGSLVVSSRQANGSLLVIAFRLVWERYHFVNVWVAQFVRGLKQVYAIIMALLSGMFEAVGGIDALQPKFLSHLLCSDLHNEAVMHHRSGRDLPCMCVSMSCAYTGRVEVIDEGD